MNSLFRSATPSVTWADIDGDGHSELVIGSWDGDLKVFKKNCTAVTFGSNEPAVVNNASSCHVAGWTLNPNATNPLAPAIQLASQPRRQQNIVRH